MPLKSMNLVTLSNWKTARTESLLVYIRMWLVLGWEGVLLTVGSEAEDGDSKERLEGPNGLHPVVFVHHGVWRGYSRGCCCIVLTGEMGGIRGRWNNA